MFRSSAGLVLMMAPVAAGAQAPQCRVPAVLPTVTADGPTSREPRRALPIGGYTLALSWTPEKCRTRRDNPRDSFQCGKEAPRFGFTLHGLWPDGRGAQWPQYCRRADILPTAVIRKNLCATPSAQLLQHEWAKHGTCMATDPNAYFDRASRLYRAIRYPDMAALSRTSLTAGKLARAVAAANPGLRPDMLKVTATRTGWLDELWICLGTDFRPRRCPRGGGVAAASAINIWRGGR